MWSKKLKPYIRLKLARNYWLFSKLVYFKKSSHRLLVKKNTELVQALFSDDKEEVSY